MSNPLTFARDRRRNEDGFTLIELLVVVVILGILIGIAIPVYLNYRKSAADKAAQSDARSVVSTLELCNSDAGYPVSVTSAGAMTTCTGQTISLSDRTTMRYTAAPSGAAQGSVTSYTIATTNGGGSGAIYCYNSATGGGVKQATAPANPTLANATC